MLVKTGKMTLRELLPEPYITDVSVAFAGMHISDTSLFDDALGMSWIPDVSLSKTGNRRVSVDSAFVAPAVGTLPDFLADDEHSMVLVCDAPALASFCGMFTGNVPAGGISNRYNDATGSGQWTGTMSSDWDTVQVQDLAAPTYASVPTPGDRLAIICAIDNKVGGGMYHYVYNLTTDEVVVDKHLLGFVEAANAIGSISSANPAVVNQVGHDIPAGTTIKGTFHSVGGTFGDVLNGNEFDLVYISANTYSITGVNGAGLTYPTAVGKMVRTALGPISPITQTWRIENAANMSLCAHFIHPAESLPASWAEDLLGIAMKAEKI